MSVSPGAYLDLYRSQFAVLERRLNGRAGSPLHARRRAALDLFLASGFPTTAMEEWRFTDVMPLAGKTYAMPGDHVAGSVPCAEADPWVFGGEDAPRLVFVDGRFAPDLSSRGGLPPSVRVANLAEGLAEGEAETWLAGGAGAGGDPFAALNTAFLDEGALVVVPPGMELEEPVSVVFLATGGSTPLVAHPRLLLVAGRGSRVSLAETYATLGTGLHFTNAVSEVILEEDASLEHDTLQNEAPGVLHVGSVHVLQRGGSSYTATGVTLGGGIVRNNVTAVLDGEGCACTLNGLSLATGTRLVDNHTSIVHARPRCNSHQLSKAILDGRARGVFHGKIRVLRDAQKTDAKQTNRTLLLSDGAVMDTKPQLEIFADDVKCTHGATVGQLDEAQVFYCRSRGLGEEEARDVLTFAFASDVVRRLHLASLRERLDRMIHQRLHSGRLSDEA
ncbi:MAG: Fe-S cluster assembly protein SufD [Bacteroidota bacterium]